MADAPSTKTPRRPHEKPADALADDPSAAALQKHLKALADDAQERGYVGEKSDPTPRENYTLRGVGLGLPTPETTVRNADPLHRP